MKISIERRNEWQLKKSKMWRNGCGGQELTNQSKGHVKIEEEDRKKQRATTTQKDKSAIKASPVILLPP